MFEYHNKLYQSSWIFYTKTCVNVYIYLVRFHQYTHPTLVVVVFSCWWRFWAWHVIETKNSLQYCLCKLYFMHEIIRRMLLHLCVGIMNFLNQITQGCDLESFSFQLRIFFGNNAQVWYTMPPLKAIKMRIS
jgi:hypothetical protein